MLDISFQWFFNNVRDMQQYDYIVGKLYSLECKWKQKDIKTYKCKSNCFI